MFSCGEMTGYYLKCQTHPDAASDFSVCFRSLRYRWKKPQHNRANEKYMSYSSGKRYFQIAKCYENRMSFISKTLRHRCLTVFWIRLWLLWHKKITKQTNSKKEKKKALVRLVGFYNETIDPHHVFFIFII